MRRRTEGGGTDPDSFGHPYLRGIEAAGSCGRGGLGVTCVVSPLPTFLGICLLVEVENYWHYGMHGARPHSARPR